VVQRVVKVRQIELTPYSATLTAIGSRQGTASGSIAAPRTWGEKSVQGCSYTRNSRVYNRIEIAHDALANLWLPKSPKSYSCKGYLGHGDIIERQFALGCGKLKVWPQISAPNGFAQYQGLPFRSHTEALSTLSISLCRASASANRVLPIVRASGHFQRDSHVGFC
jgi:hypothetical protein